jgi:hypothetical protein
MPVWLPFGTPDRSTLVSRTVPPSDPALHAETLLTAEGLRTFSTPVVVVATLGVVDDVRVHDPVVGALDAELDGLVEAEGATDAGDAEGVVDAAGLASGLATGLAEADGTDALVAPPVVMSSGAATAAIAATRRNTDREDRGRTAGIAEGEMVEGRGAPLLIVSLIYFRWGLV